MIKITLVFLCAMLVAEAVACMMAGLLLFQNESQRKMQSRVFAVWVCTISSVLSCIIAAVLTILSISAWRGI
jgi:hypothetical protein